MIALNTAGIPSTEYDEIFLQGMIDRMGVSFAKYGKVKDGFPEHINALESMFLRIKKYKETGNKEFLMDAANFAMIEFMFPAHPEAYFKATDSRESPGRVWRDLKNPTQKGNKE